MGSTQQQGAGPCTPTGPLSSTGTEEGLLRGVRSQGLLLGEQAIGLQPFHTYSGDSRSLLAWPDFRLETLSSLSSRHRAD